MCTTSSHIYIYLTKLRYSGPIKNEKGYNVASNNTNELNKDISVKLVVRFTTLNETGRRSYFEQYWSPRSAGHSKMEKRFIYALSYTALVPKIIRIVTIQIFHILPL